MRTQIFIAISVLSACLPEPGGTLTDPVNEEMSVWLEPAGPLDAAPPILRVRVRWAAGPLDPEKVHLIAGEVGSAHISQLVRDDVSATLAERMVPSLRWAEGDEVVLAPTMALEAGGEYAVASAQAARVVEMVVAADDVVPTMALTWPPEGIGVGEPLIVWCGGGALPPFSLPAELSPGEHAIALASAASAYGHGAHCVHTSVPSAATPPVVAPPSLDGPDGAPFARVEPTPLRNDGELPITETQTCADGQLPLGIACVTVLDDRMLVTVPESERLWMFADALPALLLDHVAPQLGRGSFWAHPLVPASAIDLHWASVDIAGQIEGGVRRIHTLPPMAHLVITEVLANPVGLEPDQEWIEIYNDGLAAADLGDYIVEDIGGVTAPPVGSVLPSGAYALLVNETYDPTFEYDPAPSPDALVIRVPKLGKGGLNNQGEPLKLVRVSGEVVSRFPPMPKPKSGKSVARAHPRAADDDASAFFIADPTPGAANATDQPP